MRKSVVVLAALLRAALGCTAASANDPTFGSGNYWLTPCQNNSPMCSGYVVGLIDMHDLMVAIEVHPPRWCAPKTVTYGQMQLVTVAYMQRNPQSLHLQFSVLIIGALSEAFPCKR